MAFSLNRIRRSFLVLALVLAGSLVLAVGPAGILADQHDNTSSIEQFQPITISESTIIDLEAVASELDSMTLLMIYMEIQDFGELDTNLSEESFQEVESFDAVDRHLGGAFATPDYLPAGIETGETKYMTGDAGYASYTFDVAKAHRISQLLDLPTDWLPDPGEHSHLTISLDVPASGLAGWKSGEQRLMVGQIGTPDLDIPDELDLDALRDAILNDPRLPDELADQLDAIDDWETTMPVPVPEGAEYRDVTINGGTGFLMSIDEGSAVVWEVDGTLYFVAGTYSGEEVQQIAESMS